MVVLQVALRVVGLHLLFAHLHQVLALGGFLVLGCFHFEAWVFLVVGLSGGLASLSFSI